ncbi:hypothetical protein BC833DRAFT_568685 [Globomyces pollinis-pini]|nr:hypothetical protein BC833DRAFT_568685 [Globomyces pollinis-pini]
MKSNEELIKQQNLVLDLLSRSQSSLVNVNHPLTIGIDEIIQAQQGSAHLLGSSTKIKQQQSFVVPTRPRETSWVRQHVTKLNIDGVEKARCIYCQKGSFKVSNTSAIARHLIKEHQDIISQSNSNTPMKAQNNNIQNSFDFTSKPPAKRLKSSTSTNNNLNFYADTFQKATQAVARLDLLVQKTLNISPELASPLVQDLIRCLSILYSPNQWHYQLPDLYISIWHLALQDFEYYPYVCWHAITTYQNPHLKEVFGINHDPLAFGIGTEEERISNLRLEFKNIFERELFEANSNQ